MKKNKLVLLIPAVLTTLASCNKNNTQGPYTIKFESNGGTSYKNVAVIHGDKLAKPTDPQKQGYNFICWCTDEQLNKEYNFDAPVESSFTLYAKWAYKPVIQVESVVISTTTLTMKVGETFQLGATVLPETASDKSVTWTSSNKELATVSSTGLVTALKTTNAFNQLNIIVSTNDGNKYDICNVTIERDLSKNIDSITIGEYPLLKATEGNELDLNGLEVIGVMKDGSTRLLEKNEYETSPKHGDKLKKAGNQTVTITAISNPNAEASFNIRVRSKTNTIVAIELDDSSVKQQYNEDECFNPTGLVITATYLDKHTGTIDISDCDFTPSLTHKLTPEDTTITVSPKDFPNVSGFVNIEVKKKSIDALPSYLTLEESKGTYGNILSRNFDSSDPFPSELTISPKYSVNGKELTVDSLCDFSETNHTSATRLNKITVPDTVKYILNGCFKDCSQLDTISFGEDSQLLGIDSDSFQNTTSLKTFIVPKDVKIIMYDVFKGGGLETLEFKNATDWYILDNYTPVTIGTDDEGKAENAKKMKDCSGETEDSWGYYGLDKQPAPPEYVNNFLFFGNKINDTVLVQYRGSESNEIIEIPEYVDGAYIIGDGYEEGVQYKVTEICENCFAFHSEIKKVIIPSSITFIDGNAFQGCRGLEEIEFKEGSQLKEILEYAFAITVSLKEISFPASLKIIDPNAFKNSGITKVTFDTEKTWCFLDDDDKEIDIDISNPETNATNLKKCDEEYEEDCWGDFGIFEKGYL